MLDRRAIVPLASLVLTVAVSAASAGPAADLPPRYSLGARDGAPVQVTQPLTGRTFAIWSYRSGAEYDLAIAVREVDGRWNAPAFLGAADRLDQTTPAIETDPWGNLYLAYAVRETGQILLTALPLGHDGWTEPVSVTRGGERGLSPSLAIVSDRLVIAYRSFQGRVVIGNVALLGPPMRTQGIQDGPDGIDPLGETPTSPSPDGTNE
jgi:hypothetical protein